MDRLRNSRLLKRIAALRPCADCAQSQGLWRDTRPGARCACIRGQLLAKLDAIRQRRPAPEMETAV